MVVKKEDLETREAGLAALEEDIDRRKAEVERRELELMTKEEGIKAVEERVEGRRKEVDGRLEELEEKEKALHAGAKDAAPAAPPRPPRKRLRYKCLRRCHHPINPGRPETRKVFMPGEELYAYEGDEIPRHFKLIRDVVDEAEANKEINLTNMRTLPPYLAKREATVHGG